MNLYLVQHAEPKPEEEDPERSLSATGREEIRKTAAFAAGVGVRAEVIRHSGKTRARQTAEALSASLSPVKGIAEADGLKPLDDPSVWAERLALTKDDTMLVGHLPHLSRLAGLLVMRDPESSPISFRMGGMLCLARDDTGGWTVRWMVTPELLS
ncbi:MAG: phosphohistidine phosphatase SixA [Anaerolineae bacterium]